MRPSRFLEKEYKKQVLAKWLGIITFASNFAHGHLMKNITLPYRKKEAHILHLFHWICWLHLLHAVCCWHHR